MSAGFLVAHYARHVRLGLVLTLTDLQVTCVTALDSSAYLASVVHGVCVSIPVQALLLRTGIKHDLHKVLYIISSVVL